ncbi:MAG TPA: efflux RND transporter periplasmic adaptor subunit [Gemmatimonadaceae bacterium]|nr:efflux RND transporter periplasmic adaptor subunit [Gemmatimonadaceae bacterium]
MSDLASVPPAPPWWRRRTAIALGIVLVLCTAAAISLRGGSQLQYFTAEVTRGDIRDVVDVTGTLNALRTVQVGSQVSGTIAKLYVDFNSRVHVGDLVAEIDPRLLQGALLQANADLANARAGVIAARATVDRLRASLVQTKADYDRAVQLAQGGAMTQAELDLATANYDGAKASVDAAVANVAQAEAGVRQKEAAVTLAQTNLSYTVIRSPINGVVVSRNVDVGQTVAASLQAPTIFTIAQDLSQMQVYAKMDESDVGRIKVGQRVTFQVDAFPKDTFPGQLKQMRMNATTVQNVVTYDAIIDCANPDGKLFPGMTAYVTIPVASVHDVVRVPNGALRYRPPLPPDEIHSLYAKSGIASDSTAGTAAPSGDEAKHPIAAGDPVRPARRDRAATAVVWKRLPDGAIAPVEVALGITDHAVTEVTSVLAGSLTPGDVVITGSLAASTTAPPGAPSVRR